MTQKVHDPELLKDRMKIHGVDPDSEALKDYADAFAYGTPPHDGGGGGISLERELSCSIWDRAIFADHLYSLSDPKRLRP